MERRLPASAAPTLCNFFPSIPVTYSNTESFDVTLTQRCGDAENARGGFAMLLGKFENKHCRE